MDCFYADLFLVARPAGRTGTYSGAKHLKKFTARGTAVCPISGPTSEGSTDMHEILDYLKKGGERLDSEIAAATGFTLAKVRQQVKDLHARGAVMVCRSIRYTEGKEIEGVLCRISGYTPPAAPGRKAKPKTPAKALAED